MLIRSQNGKILTKDVNLEIKTSPSGGGPSFEEIMNGAVPDETKYVSKIYTSAGQNIAEYSTEEKAIKVLNMIFEDYRNLQFVDAVRFQMPQDDEVK